MVPLTGGSILLAFGPLVICGNLVHRLKLQLYAVPGLWMDYLIGKERLDRQNP